MKFIQALKNQLDHNDLPGRIAQHDMAHGERKTWLENYKMPSNPKIAATLTLLYPKQEIWYIALMQRVSHAKDMHGGQVSFPGGKAEESDIDLKYTALREAEEELGISPNDVTILGQMTELYIPVSNFLVYPFIGFSEKPPVFNLQQAEVQRVIEAPLSILLDKKNRKFKDIHLPNNIRLKNVPYFDVNGNVVWGATAMMLSEFAAIVKQVTPISRLVEKS
ncbi:MAG: CoA pyrophosphatase [Saprospiraceae bacterium]|nr:CoA pyrophosphatase [Saprospiraceae bacterium]